METSHGTWTCAGALLVCAQAAAQQAPDMQLPSCVAGSPPLMVAADSAWATLDSTDRSRFHEAAQARYPLYKRGGLGVADVLVLRRGTQWLYITTSPMSAKGPCFSAVFAANRFDFTERWLTKYRPGALEADN